jgi:hypothetical protein
MPIRKHKRLNIFAFYIELTPGLKGIAFLFKYTLDSALSLDIHLEMNSVQVSEKLFKLRTGIWKFILNT